MNLGDKQLEIKFEKAVRLLCDYSSIDEGRKKSILMHALRVGMYLYENDYQEDVVISGLLHDIIEWADCPEDLVQKEFGQRVLDIIKANTKDREIEDVDTRRADYVNRCAQVGKEALIVKAADVLDSHGFYRATNNTDELQRSKTIAKLVLSVLPDGVADPIFKKLEVL
jgi:(p)ppGpp synthase/HD superfamily hydrolase